jgi:hypothetical protein
MDRRGLPTVLDATWPRIASPIPVSDARPRLRRGRFERRPATTERGALGTLAKLELRGAVCQGADGHGRALSPARRRGRQGRFPVASMRRQFNRYLEIWPDESWRALAERAVETLPEDTSWVGAPTAVTGADRRPDGRAADTWPDGEPAGPKGASPARLSSVFGARLQFSGHPRLLSLSSAVPRFVTVVALPLAMAAFTALCMSATVRG